MIGRGIEQLYGTADNAEGGEEFRATANLALQ
jgi:hypothetical protein